jgi:RNase P subunit RPR2|tara:strand:- start:19 stop:186 length:168 start_codon:yes stop_codon:yes gene_type:complete
MKKVMCDTCDEMVNPDNAVEYGYYSEVWQCEPCNEMAEIQADEGLTVEERAQAWD